MYIIIPTTYFAKKVVLSEHQLRHTARQSACILPLKDGDELFDELRYKRTLLKTENATKLLATELTIEISPILKKHIGDDLLAVGLRLDRWAKGIFCREVALRVKMGIAPYAAINDFYAAHDLDEWDFSREAAIKRVQRHNSKKYLPKNAKKEETVVLQNSRFLVKLPEISIIYTEKDLEAFAVHYEKMYPSIFRDARRRDLTLRHRHLRLWIALEIGNRSPQSLAKQNGISISAVYRVRQNFVTLLHTQRKPLPTPTSASFLAAH